MTATSTVTVPSVADAAVWAARHGWYVFPLVRNQKRPGVADWENAASADPDYIARSWPRWATGYGIAAGRSGLYVIDGDVPKPDTPPPPHPDVRTGLDMFALLAEEAGESVNFATFATRTGRGGDHLYYLMPPGMDLRNTAYGDDSALGWCIDTRGGGGYVIGPGSVVNGNTYTTVHVERPVPLSRWVVDLLARRKAEAQPASQGAVSSPPPPALVSRPAPGSVPVVGKQWIEAAIDGEAERVRTAPSGGGNAVLSSASYRLGQLVGATLVSREAAEAVLTSALDTWTWSKPGDRVRMLRTLNSGLASGERNPRVPAPREPRKRATA